MKNTKLKCSFLSAIFLFLISTSVFASVITMNAIPLDFRYQNLPSYTEGNFKISASCRDCLNVFSTTEPNAGYGASTAAAGWGASGRFLETWNTSVIFTLSETSGNAFNFIGFDIGWFDNNTNNASWDVKGYDNLGNLVANHAYTGKGHFDLSYWNVSSITFKNKGGFSSFDNLNVTVPEPSLFALLAAGLIGLMFVRRRKLQA
jgi:hypothetical protein